MAGGVRIVARVPDLMEAERNKMREERDIAVKNHFNAIQRAEDAEKEVKSLEECVDEVEITAGKLNDEGEALKRILKTFNMADNQKLGFCCCVLQDGEIEDRHHATQCQMARAALAPWKEIE